jgi:hypothetical protein
MTEKEWLEDMHKQYADALDFGKKLVALDGGDDMETIFGMMIAYQLVVSQIKERLNVIQLSGD